MRTAPVRPREPPAIVTFPELNLVEAAPRGGARSRKAGSISRAAGSTGAPSGMPIGATRSSPVWALPGATRWPTFAAWKETVVEASIAIPSTSPLEASTPEAMSQATIVAPQRLAASIAAAAGSRGSPSKPVPKIASTTTAESASQASRSEGRASPKISSASTSKPVPSRRRAATMPSAPLLPLPQRMRIGPWGAEAATASASAVPAASTRSASGIPCSSIAQRSTARISSASKSGRISRARRPPPRALGNG